MPGLSVTVITLNEAANIDACLASVSWVDDILVVDSGSTDGTIERAEARGARVIRRDWPGSYAAQKNFAAEQATHDWILSLDADERVTPALADEIKTVLASEPPVGGYRIPRLTWHLGRWIRTTDWYPDYQLRLYHRRRANWPPRLVHESVHADSVGYLKNDLEHFAYRDISHHHEAMNRYTTLAAKQMYEQGRRAGVFDVVVHPPAAFFRNYVLKRGFADGVPGFIISVMNAQYVFLKFAKLWAMGRTGATGTSGTPGTPGTPGTSA